MLMLLTLYLIGSIMEQFNNTYAPVRNFAYNSTTEPVHPKGDDYNNTSFSKFSKLGEKVPFLGSFISAAGGIVSDIWQSNMAQSAARYANRISRENAARANAASIAEARAAREWNSEQQQIRRMRMAGLSPGLAYGQMSPSTAQAANIQQADSHKPDTPQLRGADELIKALKLMIDQQQADTAAAAQASNATLQGSQTQLNLIDALTRNQSNLTNIAEVAARKDWTDAQKLELITLLAGKQQIQNAEVENLNASARNANANAAVVEATGVRAAESEISKNLAAANLSKQQEESLKLEFNINNQQWSNLSKMLEDYGYGDLLAPVVMRVITSMAENAHVSISTILNNLTHFSGSIMDAVMDYLGLTSESVETRTELDSFDQESSYNKGRSESSGSRSHTTTTTRKGRR